jgi:hypothetical protein
VGKLLLPVSNHHRLHHLFKYLDRAWTWTGWFEERGCHKVLERLGIRLELGERQGVADDRGQLDQILPIIIRPDSRFGPLGAGCPFRVGCIRGRIVCQRLNSSSDCSLDCPKLSPRRLVVGVPVTIHRRSTLRVFRNVESALSIDEETCPSSMTSRFHRTEVRGVFETSRSHVQFVIRIRSKSGHLHVPATRSGPPRRNSFVNPTRYEGRFSGVETLDLLSCVINTIYPKCSVY